MAKDSTTKLTGTEFKKLQQALEKSFPTYDLLEQMVRTELDMNLEGIVGRSSVLNAAFKLIQSAEANGKVDELVQGARNANPDNPTLKRFAEQYFAHSNMVSIVPDNNDDRAAEATRTTPRLDSGRVVRNNNATEAADTTRTVVHDKTLRAKTFNPAWMLVFIFAILSGLLLLRGNQPPVLPTGLSSTNPVEIHPLAFYADSLQAWITPAKKKLGLQDDDLKAYGSRDAKQAILYKHQFSGKGGHGANSKVMIGRPTLYLPADDYWLSKLNQDWTNPTVGNHSENIADQGTVLLHSRLVLIMRTDRAVTFREKRREHQGKTWATLRELARDGWPGGTKLDLFLADPIDSHSGVAALLLMFAEYCGDHLGANPGSPDFEEFLQPLLMATNISYYMTDSLVQDFLKDAALENGIAIGYETNVFHFLKQNPNAQVSIIYPEPTLDIKFSVATLKGDWVSPVNRQNAQAFIKELVSPSSQQIALKEFGFRPPGASDESIQTTFANSQAGFLVSPITVKLKTVPKANGCQIDYRTGELIIDPYNLNGLIYNIHRWSPHRGNGYNK